MSEAAEDRAGQLTPIDRTVKVLIRRVPEAFIRLAGLEASPVTIRPEDTAINLAEFRADGVLIVGTETDPERWALHVECQLQPDTRVPAD